MPNDTFLAVFADFNEPRPMSEAPPPPEETVPVSQVEQIRSDAWTDGYLAGRQGSRPHPAEAPLTASLLTAVHDLHDKTEEAVDAASIAVADLLVSTVIAAASDNWGQQLMSRVRELANRIKPALTFAPEFILRDDGGTEHHFNDMADLSRALEDGVNGEDVTIRWRRGEATISRTALLQDLRNAILPLTAGLKIDQSQEQNA